MIWEYLLNIVKSKGMLYRIVWNQMLLYSYSALVSRVFWCDDYVLADEVLKY